MTPTQPTPDSPRPRDQIRPAAAGSGPARTTIGRSVSRREPGLLAGSWIKQGWGEALEATVDPGLSFRRCSPNVGCPNTLAVAAIANQTRHRSVNKHAEFRTATVS